MHYTCENCIHRSGPICSIRYHRFSDSYRALVQCSFTACEYFTLKEDNKINNIREKLTELVKKYEKSIASMSLIGQQQELSGEYEIGCLDGSLGTAVSMTEDLKELLEEEK